MAADEPSSATLRDPLSQLPCAEYQDIKGIWEAGEKLTNGSTNTPVVSRTRFVANTHSLRWYFRSLELLSVSTSALFRLPAQLFQASGSVGAHCHHRL